MLPGGPASGTREAGASRRVYIGSDAPLLEESYYTRARRALDEADVVLGPAEDGGVTLMGARVPWPPLADLPWSQATLRGSLERRCRANGLTVLHLDTRFDIDAAEQLPRLHRALGDDRRPARRALRAWLEAAM